MKGREQNARSKIGRIGAPVFRDRLLQMMVTKRDVECPQLVLGTLIL